MRYPAQNGSPAASDLMAEHISLTAALSDAWNRMQTILFRPFDLKKWMVLGFTAWLAGLAHGGSSFNWNVGGWSDSSDSEVSSSVSVPVVSAKHAPASLGVETGLDGPDRDLWSQWSQWSHWSQWPLEHPLWFAAGVFGCVVLLVLFVVILWLSSRGKFMFLDNVVHNRAEVTRPWRRYQRLGNSHFSFQLAFYGLFMVTGLAAVLFVLVITSGLGMSFGGGSARLGLLVAVPVAVLVVCAVATIQYFLDGFVVPLMYRYDLGVLDAWRRFGAILRRHPWPLLLSGLFLLLLGFAAMLVALAAGLLTCCIGLLLMIIPYIGTVVLLPIPVTYRAFTVALLDQIEPGYFPDQESGGAGDPAKA